MEILYQDLWYHLPLYIYCFFPRGLGQNGSIVDVDQFMEWSEIVLELDQKEEE